MKKHHNKTKKILQPRLVVDKYQLDVPGDNSCLFWAAMMAYLIPVLDDMESFKARYKILFGESKLEHMKMLHTALKEYDPFTNTSLYKNDKINSLVREDFRARVITLIATNKETYEHYCEGNFFEYCTKMQRVTSWGGDLEVNAISGLLKCNLILIKGENTHKYPNEFDGDPSIVLVHANYQGKQSGPENHYNFLIASDIYKPPEYEEEQDDTADKSVQPANQRRLDSLARLLEFDMTCAAVCLIGDTIYITTNDIYARTIQGKSPKLSDVESAARHFLSEDFCNKGEYTKNDINIILSNYKGKLATETKGRQGDLGLNDKVVSAIIKHLLASESIKSFMSDETPLGFFMQFIDKKLAKPHEKFNEVMKVQRCFNRIWRDVRDYKKVKKMIMETNGSENPIRNYCILAVGGKDDHAEMRMLGYLLNRDDTFTPADSKLLIETPLYIGISKLCCPYCYTTLKEINEVIDLKPVDSKEVVNLKKIVVDAGDGDILSLEDSFEKSVEQLAEPISDAALGARGYHDLRFKWSFPSFLRLVKTDDKSFKCVERAKLEKCDKKYLLYYKSTKQDDVMCLVNIDAAIVKNKNTFVIGSSPIKFMLNVKHMKGKTVPTEVIREQCQRFYTSGFKPKMLMLSCGKKEEEWLDLKTGECEQLNLNSLQDAKFHEKVLMAYIKINESVSVKGQVVMVADASSSSLEDSEEELDQEINKKASIKAIPQGFLELAKKLEKEKEQYSSTSGSEEDSSYRSSQDSSGESSSYGTSEDSSEESSSNYEP